MKRYRKSLSALLGLVLLLQGVAVSAAPCAMPHAEAPATMSMDMGSDMPCHGQTDDTTVAADAGNSQSCCGIDCPDMSSCTLGHAAINTSFLFAMEHVPETAPLQASVRVLDQSLPSLLRPPISLHG